MGKIDKIGRTISSESYWRSRASSYSGSLGNDYHRHRLEVIRALLPTELFSPGRRVFDFGCGDASLFPLFIERGAEIQGADLSTEMVALARERLRGSGLPADLVRVGGVDSLTSLPEASLDGLLAFNTLAYFSDVDEEAFYEHASRIVKPGGFLVLTHSNELFDMFSLNSYTVDFFSKHFVDHEGQRARLRTLLVHADAPEYGTSYNVRENPLTYRYKLARYGFREVAQEFINRHVAPPGPVEKEEYPDTLNVDAEARWKLMFVCSTFGSRSVRADGKGS